MVISASCHFLINGGTIVEDLFLLLSAHKSESVSGLLKPVKINLDIDKERINK